MQNIIKKYILLFLIILCLIFIFFNSFKNAEQSRADSGRVVEIIEKVVDAVCQGNPPEKLDSFLVTASRNVLRNYAHFLEFFILGILTMLYSYSKFKVAIFKRLSFVFLFCILIALIDETIQFFSPGRAFELYDLLLDGLGSIIGVILILLLHKIKERRKYKEIPE